MRRRVPEGDRGVCGGCLRRRLLQDEVVDGLDLRLGSRVEDVGFGAWGLGFRVQDLGLRVYG